MFEDEFKKGFEDAKIESERYSPSRKVLKNKNSIFEKTRSFIEQKK